MQDYISLISDPYFFWSFLPLSFLGISFWLLFFERNVERKDSLWIFVLAIGAGGISAIVAHGFLLQISLKVPFFSMSGAGFFSIILVEEILKIISAILVMEVFRQKFQTIAGGILFGFSVGLGFSLIENMLYLQSFYENFGFSESFWLGFQGRFWSSMLIHGVTTGFFGIFYAGAYLSKTLKKAENKSPLSVLSAPLSLKSFRNIISLKCTRHHLLFHQKPCLAEFTSRAVILEGLCVSLILHGIFNALLHTGFVVAAIFLAIFGMIFLRSTVERLR